MFLPPPQKKKIGIDATDYHCLKRYFILVHFSIVNSCDFPIVFRTIHGD